MSRSVETVSDATIIYFDCLEYDEWEWTDLIDNLQYELIAKYPSFDESNSWVSWPYRENRIILENYLCSISISEYCGCGAISIFVNDACEYPELAEYWIGQVENNIIKLIEGFVSPLIKVATYSNGEAICQKKKERR